MKKARRKYRKLSEQDVLDAILAGRFTIDADGNVFSVNGTARQLIPHLDPQGRPCIKFYVDGGRRSTTLGRAVWMIHNRQLVPEGHAVDHIDRDKTNNRPGNLRIRDWSENSSENQYFGKEDDF